MCAARLFRNAVLLCAALFGATLAQAEDRKSIHPTGYVTDLAGVIGAEQKASLEALSTELEQKTGTQMAIVTVRSLEGESVEDYTVDLFKQLGIGSKKDNRGVLLLLAPAERKYRIEVGYGLEPVINDARAGDAGRAMVPFLRQGDYGDAVETAAWQLARYVADDSKVTLSNEPSPRRIRHRNSGGASGIFWLFVGLIILFSFLGRASRGGGSRGGGSGGSGLLWFLLGMMANSGRGSRGDWGGGGFGGGSGGGGFGGFGGGSSGGGGASGSW